MAELEMQNPRFTTARVKSGVDLQLSGSPAAVDNHEISLQLCIELMIS